MNNYYEQIQNMKYYGAKEIIPEMFGRQMKLIKQYKRFVLFKDEKTGIRECFLYYDLIKPNDNGKTEINNKMKKQNIKDDVRLLEIIKEMQKR